MKNLTEIEFRERLEVYKLKINELKEYVMSLDRKTKTLQAAKMAETNFQYTIDFYETKEKYILQSKILAERERHLQEYLIPKLNDYTK